LTTQFPKPNHAYGVDPRRKEYYSLRQARYDALAEDIDRWAGEAERLNRKLKVIDVGLTQGILLRHLEPRPHFANIDMFATDYRLQPPIYRQDRYVAVTVDDLMEGNPNSPSDAFDIVVCEQVLEHIPDLSKAIPALARMAKPGGKVSIGVPIFLAPLAAARNAYVRASLRFRPRKQWSHVQTFSMGSFLRRIKAATNLKLIEARGFRVISGGPLRGLENSRAWWAFNRRLGKAIPWACIEVQAIFEKPAA